MKNEYKLKRAEDFLIAAYWNFLKYNKDDEGKDRVGENAPKKPSDGELEDISEEYYLCH